MRWYSFSSKLGVAVLLRTLLLFVLVISGMAYLTYITMKEYAKHDATVVLSGVKAEVETILSNIESGAHALQWVALDNIDNPEYVANITKEFVNSNPLVLGSAIAFEPYFYKRKGELYAPYTYRNEDNELKTIQMGTDEYDYLLMEWYQLPKLLGESSWCEPYFDEGASNKMMTTYSVPLTKNGEVVAVLTADIALSEITSIVEKIKPYEHSETYMIGNSGSFICHSDSTKLLCETIFSEAKDFVDSSAFVELGKSMLRQEKGVTEQSTKDGEKFFMVYDSLSNGWTIALACPYSDVFVDATVFNIVLLIIILACSIILSITTRKTIRRSTIPLTEFSYSAMNIAKGNFNARIPEVDTEDEIKKLQNALTYMRDSFLAYTKEIRSQTAANARYASELGIASSIQEQMLSHNFDLGDKVDLYATLHPAKEVGGDLYDFFIKGNNLYFMIGDVSGKGVPAALFMAITKSIFHLVAKLDMPMRTVVSTINNSFCDGNECNMFVTLFAGKVNLDTMKMQFCNGGHNPIIIKDPDGSARFLQCKPNLAAGLFKDFPYMEEEVQLSHGSKILLYTDGVSEAETRSKELYGDDRLLEFVNKAKSETPTKEFVYGLLASVKEFTDGNEQNDDITIVAIDLR